MRGWGREGVRSEARAEQRLAPGGAVYPEARLAARSGQRSPNPDLVKARYVRIVNSGALSLLRNTSPAADSACNVETVQVEALDHSRSGPGQPVAGRLHG